MNNHEQLNQMMIQGIQQTRGIAMVGMPPDAVALQSIGIQKLNSNAMRMPMHDHQSMKTLKPPVPVPVGVPMKKRPGDQPNKQIKPKKGDKPKNQDILDDQPSAATPDRQQAEAQPEKKKKKGTRKKDQLQQQEQQQMRIVFNVFNTQYDVIKEVGKREFNWKLSNKDPWTTQIEWDIQWADVAPMLSCWKDMKPFQKINHFPGMYQIARKNYLARNLNKMQKQFPDDYKFFPKTWLLPHQLEDLKSYSQQYPSSNFIVKPEALSQGKGIFITRKFDQIDMTEHLVVQKYIKNPYLIDGFKFDFRVYVLVTNVQPLRIFIFRDGLARFASEKYKLKAFNNPFIHLTNYAINKDNANYRVDQTADASTGHKRSLDSIFVKIGRDGHDVEVLKAKMRDIVVKTLISIQPDLVHHYRTSQPSDIYNNMCFEILGFDILVDKNGTPWLLEVNHAPSFNCDTALDAEVKRNLVEDTFRIVNTTVQEKQHIIGVLKQMHEQRVLGISKKQDFYQMRQEMQQIKLKDMDEYQVQNLGGFERVFPPMKLYHKTEVIPEEPKTPQLDPLSMKLRQLDKQMDRKKKEGSKTHADRSIIPNNKIDEKMHAYYQNFQNVAKQFVADMRVAKQSKITQDQKNKNQNQNLKPPAPKKKIEPKVSMGTAGVNSQLGQIKKPKKAEILLSDNEKVSERLNEKESMISLSNASHYDHMGQLDPYEEDKYNFQARGRHRNAENPQIGEYGDEDSMTNWHLGDPIGDPGQYMETEEELSGEDDQPIVVARGGDDDITNTFSTPGASLRNQSEDPSRMNDYLLAQGMSAAAGGRERGYSQSMQHDPFILLQKGQHSAPHQQPGLYKQHPRVHMPRVQQQLEQLARMKASRDHPMAVGISNGKSQFIGINNKGPAGLIGVTYQPLGGAVDQQVGQYLQKNGLLRNDYSQEHLKPSKSAITKVPPVSVHNVITMSARGVLGLGPSCGFTGPATLHNAALLPGEIRDSLMVGASMPKRDIDSTNALDPRQGNGSLEGRGILQAQAARSQQHHELLQSRGDGSRQEDYRDRVNITQQMLNLSARNNYGQVPYGTIQVMDSPASSQKAATGGGFRASESQKLESNGPAVQNIHFPTFKKAMIKSPQPHRMSGYSHNFAQSPQIKVETTQPSRMSNHNYTGVGFSNANFQTLQFSQAPQPTHQPRNVMGAGYELPSIAQRQTPLYRSSNNATTTNTSSSIIAKSQRDAQTRLTQPASSLIPQIAKSAQNAKIQSTTKTIIFPSMIPSIAGATAGLRHMPTSSQHISAMYQSQPQSKTSRQMAPPAERLPASFSQVQPPHPGHVGPPNPAHSVQHVLRDQPSEPDLNAIKIVDNNANFQDQSTPKPFKGHHKSIQTPSKILIQEYNQLAPVRATKPMTEIDHEAEGDDLEHVIIPIPMYQPKAKQAINQQEYKLFAASPNVKSQHPNQLQARRHPLPKKEYSTAGKLLEDGNLMVQGSSSRQTGPIKAQHRNTPDGGPGPTGRRSKVDLIIPKDQIKFHKQ